SGRRFTCLDSSGQTHCEGRPFANVAPDVNGSAVGVDDCLADGQAQSGSAGAPRAGFIGAVKALEDARQFFRRNACSSVRNTQEGGAVFEACVDANLTVLL